MRRDDLSELAVKALQLGGQSTHLGQRRGSVAALSLCPSDLAGSLVLARPALLNLWQQLPPTLVERQQLVKITSCASTGECLPDGTRVPADELQVEHATLLPTE